MHSARWLLTSHTRMGRARTPTCTAHAPRALMCAFVLFLALLITFTIHTIASTWASLLIHTSPSSRPLPAHVVRCLSGSPSACVCGCRSVACVLRINSAHARRCHLIHSIHDVRVCESKHLRYRFKCFVQLKCTFTPSMQHIRLQQAVAVTVAGAFRLVCHII